MIATTLTEGLACLLVLAVVLAAFELIRRTDDEAMPPLTTCRHCGCPLGRDDLFTHACGGGS